MITDLFFIIICHLCDDGGVHAVEGTAKLCIFKHHCLQRSISGTFSDTEQRTVDSARTVEPCRCGIADSLVKIVVTMPFDHFRRNTGMDHQTVNDTLYGTRDHSTGIIDTITHGIATADFDRDLIFFGQFHQLQTERNDITVDICSCDILQMASRADTDLQTFTDNTQVMLHGFFSCHSHLIKNMIVRAAYQNTGFFQSHITDQFEILFAGTDPACDLRKFITLLQTFVNSIPVFFAVQEKFALTDLSFRTSKPMHIIIDTYDLFGCVRCT